MILQHKPAKTYLEWVINKGKASEYGNKVIVTDKLRLKVENIKELLGRYVGQKVVDAIIKDGQIALKLEIWQEWDNYLRSTEIGLAVDSIQGELPEHYLGMAYYAWQTEQDERINWENKSLWGYLKYWFMRTFGTTIIQD